MKYFNTPKLFRISRALYSSEIYVEDYLSSSEELFPEVEDLERIKFATSLFQEERYVRTRGNITWENNEEEEFVKFEEDTFPSLKDYSFKKFLKQQQNEEVDIDWDSMTL